jgi:thioredoxin-related protein
LAPVVPVLVPSYLPEKGFWLVVDYCFQKKKKRKERGKEKKRKAKRKKRIRRGKQMTAII